MYKLPVANIIVEAFWFPWKYKRQLLNALTLPVVLVVVISAIWTEFSSLSPSFHWAMYFIYALATSFFAVSCHRLILLNAYKTVSPVSPAMFKRMIIFLIWGLVVYLFAGIPFYFLMLIAANITSTEQVISGSHNLTDENFSLIKLVLMIPFAYFVGRFSLVLPATAVDVRSSVYWSWQTTKNNGIRMLILIGGVPWLSTIILGLLWRENGTMLEYVVLSILGYLVVAIEIFILSIAFREFKRIENLNSN